MTYVDYDGVERTESFYFNLTKAEILEMEYGIEGGMEKMLNRVTEKLDGKRIMSFVKEIILKSYGEKSPDGKRFLKVSDTGVPLHIAFEQTEAYSDLYVELVTDAKKCAEFVNAIIPKVEKADEADKADAVVS
jgi:hypothetical protein